MTAPPVPTVTRLPDHGPFRRYCVTGNDLSRYVTAFVLVRDGKHCIDHTMCCLTSLHAWPEYFDAWRFGADMAGFDITEAGREMFAKADAAYLCTRCADLGESVPATDGPYCAGCHDSIGERQDERAAAEQY